MEGKYAKISAVGAVIALLITAWQLLPKHKKDFSGSWRMTVKIESADLQTYVNSKIEWILTLPAMEELLTIQEASNWATEFLNKKVTPSNISYLVTYGRIKRNGENGNTKVALFTPMVIRSADQFRPAPPPDFESDMKELKNFKQTFNSRYTAYFWANNGPELWNDLQKEPG